MFGSGSLYLFLSAAKRSLSYDNQVKNQLCNQCIHNIISNNFIDNFRFVFCSNMGFWAIHPLAPGPWQCLRWAPSHGMGLKLKQSLLGHFHNFYATLPQHILYKGQIVTWKFCGWVVVLVPLLEVLPGYRSWPVQPLYSPLPGVLARPFSSISQSIQWPRFLFEIHVPNGALLVM